MKVNFNFDDKNIKEIIISSIPDDTDTGLDKEVKEGFNEVIKLCLQPVMEVYKDHVTIEYPSNSSEVFKVVVDSHEMGETILRCIYRNVLIILNVLERTISEGKPQITEEIMRDVIKELESLSDAEVAERLGLEKTDDDNDRETTVGEVVPEEGAV